VHIIKVQLLIIKVILMQNKIIYYLVYLPAFCLFLTLNSSANERFKSSSFQLKLFELSIIYI
jgi:hypothetical protein